MNLPEKGDYIDIHTHGGVPSEGLFIVENLMAHEHPVIPQMAGTAYTIGLHPWFFGANDFKDSLIFINDLARSDKIIAIGEAGFDKVRGAEMPIQRKVFEEQAIIAEDNNKPLIIHCVKAWDELFAVHKRLKPSVPWLIHGFHGKTEAAGQLLSRGMYLSVWYSFALLSYSADLLRYIPRERLFLETDGAEVDVRDIYKKVSIDLGLSVTELKSQIFSNFNSFLNITK
jgi:TatD DNase family protein